MNIHTIGLDAEFSNILQSRKALDNLATSADRAEASAIGLSQSTSTLNRAMGRFKSMSDTTAGAIGRFASKSGGAIGGLRGLGFQLNQVAQVGAMTGKWLEALAIQLPDILLGFGTLGIFVGIAAAAFIPLARTFVETTDYAARYADAQERLNKALKEYSSVAETASESGEDLQERYGIEAEEARRILLNRLRRQGEEVTAAASEVASLAFKDMPNIFDEMGLSSISASDRRALQEVNQLLSEITQAENVESATAAYSTLVSRLREMAEASDGINRTEDVFIGRFEDQLLDLYEARQAYRNARDAALETAEATEEVGDAADSTATSLEDQASSIREIHQEGEEAMQRLRNSLENMGEFGDPERLRELQEEFDELQSNFDNNTFQTIDIPDSLLQKMREASGIEKERSDTAQEINDQWFDLVDINEDALRLSEDYLSVVENTFDVMQSMSRMTLATPFEEGIAAARRLQSEVNDLIGKMGRVPQPQMPSAPQMPDVVQASYSPSNSERVLSDSLKSEGAEIGSYDLGQAMTFLDTEPMREVVQLQRESVGLSREMGAATSDISDEYEHLSYGAELMADHQQRLAREITNSVFGADSLGDGIANVAASIAQAVMEARILALLFNQGPYGGSTGFEGLLTPVFSALGAGIGGKPTAQIESYDGGGHTGSGPRIGGVDGKGGRYAIIHPDETITDHSKGSSATVVKPQMNVSVKNYAGDDTRVRTQQNSSGDLEIFVERIVDNMYETGRMDRKMKQRYGAKLVSE